MSRDQQPTRMQLRMSPQLRQALRVAADNAGCSLNAFAVQVLATAVGDPACFRASIDEPEAARPKHQWQLRNARNEFIGEMGMEVGSLKMANLVEQYDAEDPGYYLEWQRQRDAGRLS
jgi:hypothetical protein